MRLCSPVYECSNVGVRHQKAHGRKEVPLRVFGGPRDRSSPYKPLSSHHHIVYTQYLPTEQNMFLKAFIITMVASLARGTSLNASQSLKNHRVASSPDPPTVNTLGQ